MIFSFFLQTGQHTNTSTLKKKIHSLTHTQEKPKKKQETLKNT